MSSLWPCHRGPEGKGELGEQDEAMSVGEIADREGAPAVMKGQEQETAGPE